MFSHRIDSRAQTHENQYKSDGFNTNKRRSLNETLNIHHLTRGVLFTQRRFMALVYVFIWAACRRLGATG